MRLFQDSRRTKLINPQNSSLCGLCQKVVNCPCECHVTDISSGYHEEIHSSPIDFKVKNEGKEPMRLDYLLMKNGKIPKSIQYRLKKILKRI